MDAEKVGGIKMKKEMKELLHHILELFSYMDNEMLSYIETRDMTEDELHYLYGDLVEYIDNKYPLENKYLLEESE